MKEYFLRPHDSGDVEPRNVDQFEWLCRGINPMLGFFRILDNLFGSAIKSSLQSPA